MDFDKKPLTPMRCVVAATGLNGDPDFFFCAVDANWGEIDAGMHKDAAKALARTEGWAGDMVVFDENDAPGELLSMFHWDSATVVPASYRYKAKERPRDWEGFDLDGTLAHWDRSLGILGIGEPLKVMASKARRAIAEGVDVRIFTARVAPESLEYYGLTLAETEAAIEAWCIKHLGRKIPITCRKDIGMRTVHDDASTEVIFNRGVTVRTLLEKARFTLSQIFNLKPPDAAAAVGALAHAQSLASAALVETAE